MAFDNEYEFVPLAPMTHESLPNEMKEFISMCGMMGIMPRNNFANPIGRELGTFVDEKSRNEESSKEIYVDEQYEDDVQKYIDESEKIITRESRESGDVTNSSMRQKEDDYIKIDRVLRSIESNNLGIFKFLEINGMPYDKARKFIRRIVRLSVKYSE
ncbi:MAG: hypothetical protein RR891_03360 [Clostridium sp.]|uniref:hypothetical protein n=1 Tax=Clostridium sp. TaxID=1506 RepID=UPI003058AEDB